MLRNIITASLGFLLLTTLLPQTTPTQSQQLTNDTYSETQQEVAPAAVVAAEPVAEPKPVTTAPAPAVVEPPQPAVWSVSSSPHSRVSVATINVALAHLQAKGLTKEGAAYLIGNFISESYLDPGNCEGDGGSACGLAQWRGGRQDGMPSGLIAQLDWAIDVEMPRHAAAAGYPCACIQIKTSNINMITFSLKNWEIYGVEGGRWNYARAIYAQL